MIVDAESQHFQKMIDRVTLELMCRFNRSGKEEGEEKDQEKSGVVVV